MWLFVTVFGSVFMRELFSAMRRFLLLIMVLLLCVMLLCSCLDEPTSCSHTPSGWLIDNTGIY